MNIYFAGAISAGSEYKDQQREIVRVLEKLGHTVVSKRHAFQIKPEVDEGAINPEDIFQRDLWWILRKSDAIVAELSIPGYGIGFEIAIANIMNLPVLALAHERSEKTSAFIPGNSFNNYQFRKYGEKNLEEVLRNWLKDLQVFAKSRRGLYIAFEGLNQCGKGTQIDLLVKRLRRLKYSVWQGREPGTTWLGEQVRSLVQIQQNEVPVIQAEVSLYMSQRAQLIAKEINPRLFDNQIVVTDRSDGTNLAFQGFGRGQNILRMAVLNGYAVENIHPDITIYLDIPDKEIIRRGQVTVEEFDRYEHESGEFHQLCRQGYEEALRLDQISLPQTWFRVDAVGTPEEVHENIWEIMRPKLFN